VKYRHLVLRSRLNYGRLWLRFQLESRVGSITGQTFQIRMRKKRTDPTRSGPQFLMRAILLRSRICKEPHRLSGAGAVTRCSSGCFGTWSNTMRLRLQLLRPLHWHSTWIDLKNIKSTEKEPKLYLSLVRVKFLKSIRVDYQCRD
jgi:hypothetical protein